VLTRYDSEGAEVAKREFNVVDHPNLPYKGHASSLDYSPITGKLYWAWMQPTLEPKGAAISEHDPETLEMTRSWSLGDFGDSYLDAIAIDPGTGDFWVNTQGRQLVRIPFNPETGPELENATWYALEGYSHSREAPLTRPWIGNFSGLRVREGKAFAFTATESAGQADLGPRYNNGLVVYEIGDLLPTTGTEQPENGYSHFYRYWFPEDIPDQEGGDIIGDHAIITSTGDTIWEIKLEGE
jgi:hypothetical protein